MYRHAASLLSLAVELTQGLQRGGQDSDLVCRSAHEDRPDSARAMQLLLERAHVIRNLVTAPRGPFRTGHARGPVGSAPAGVRSQEAIRGSEA